MYVHVCILSIYSPRVSVIQCSTSFNNISCILWQSILLVDETRIPGENHWHCTLLL